MKFLLHTNKTMCAWNFNVFYPQSPEVELWVYRWTFYPFFFSFSTPLWPWVLRCVCALVLYSTVTGEEDGFRGLLNPYSTPCVVSVWQVLLVWWQNVELTFCSKKHFGALPKISDWIWKYVQIRHGFPFLKWCDTSQSVQQFGMLELSKVGCKDFVSFSERSRSRTLQCTQKYVQM